MEKTRINKKVGWDGPLKICSLAVAVTQLVEQLLPIPELCSLNPVIGKNFIEHLFSVNSSEKKEIKKKNPGMAH